MTAPASACALCASDGGVVLVRGAKLRVIRAEETPEAPFPATYRVIWTDHVAEWTDLQPTERSHLMQAVAKVETVLRQVLRPTKINLASLGNVVPHLHWHVVARFDWDSHFPQPIWGVAQRAVNDAALAALRAQLPVVDAQVATALAAAA